MATSTRPPRPKIELKTKRCQRDARRAEAALQDVVAEDARLLQVVVQIADAVGHGRRRRFDDIGDWVEHDLVRAKNAPVKLLVGIVNRQRCVTGRARAGAEERRQPRRAQPSDPTFSATHASMIPLEIPPDTGAFSASPAKDLLLGTPAPVPRNQIPAQSHASRAARRRLSPFCHTAVQLCVSRQPVIRRHGTCSASPKEQAGTGRRRRASSPATAPSACPCSTFPGGAKTTGCRRRWRSCRR